MTPSNPPKTVNEYIDWSHDNPVREMHQANLTIAQIILDRSTANDQRALNGLTLAVRARLGEIRAKGKTAERTEGGQ